MKLEIIQKSRFGFRVVDNDGEAELGSYHIADFSWKEHAEFFLKAMELMELKK